jgi:hypothetical protein
MHNPLVKHGFYSPPTTIKKKYVHVLNEDTLFDYVFLEVGQIIIISNL